MGNLAVAFRGRRRSLTAARQIRCVDELSRYLGYLEGVLFKGLRRL